jgi:pyrroline-5-carboxylate reductase
LDEWLFYFLQQEKKEVERMRKIAFIGAGAMTEAIVSGMIERGGVRSEEIAVSNKSNQERLQYMQKQYGVSGFTSLEELLQDADIVVLAVKPKDVLAVLQVARNYITENMLLISVAAGVSTESIEEILLHKMAIVRAMPNTSAAVGKSATALAPNPHTTETELTQAIDLFTAIGTVAVVKEQQLDAVTGLSGSGPAYIYYLFEAMEKSAETIGLDPAIAKQLIIQTLQGAAEMVKQSPKSPSVLRQEVTSPGGTTEAGLNILKAHHVQEAFIACIEQATLQSKKMGEQISKELKATLYNK